MFIKIIKVYLVLIKYGDLSAFNRLVNKSQNSL